MLTVLVTWVSAHLPRGERGQDLIEYAMLGGLIASALLVVAVLAAFSGALEDMFTGIGGCIDFQAGGCAPF